jgi:hypothetical protein
MQGEVVRLEVVEKLVEGELALELPPGTTAAVRDRAIDELLNARLTEIATRQGVVLSAATSAYAFPQPGKDDAGRTHFLIRGRIEGDRLLPHRPR